MNTSKYSHTAALRRLIKFYTVDNNVYRDIDPHFARYNPIKAYYALKFVADKIQWLLEKRMYLFSNKRVLDIACGSGEHAYMLQEYASTVDIWDANPLFMDLGKKLYANSNQIRCVTEDQIPNNTYDTILTSGVLELIDDYVGWLQNLVDNYNFTTLVVIAKPDSPPEEVYDYHSRHYRVDNQPVHTYTEHEKIISITGVELVEYCIFPIYQEKIFKHDKYVYIFRKK